MRAGGVRARENVHGRVREVIRDIWVEPMLLDEFSDTFEVAVACSDPDVFFRRDGHGGRRQACANRIWEICAPEWRWTSLRVGQPAEDCG